MLSLYYGEDCFHSKKALKETIESHIKHHQQINFAQFDGEMISSINDIVSEIKTLPFLSDKKLIVITNMLSNNKKTVLKNEYVEILKKLNIIKNNECHIIHYESTEDVDKRQSLFKYLQKEGEIKEFKAPNEKEAFEWITKILSEHGLTVEKEAMEILLTSQISLEYEKMAFDIEKLLLYLKSKKETCITKDIAKKLISQSISTKVFDLVDVMTKKDTKKSLLLLNYLLSEGENEFMILGALSYQIRVLLTLKLLENRKLDSSALARISGFHPFVINKNKYQIQHFSKEKLVMLLHAVCKTEYTMKTDEKDSHLLLIDLIKTCTT